MKKTIAILLVAVLAVSSVFAGFSLSGEANVSLKGDFVNKTLGFTNGENKVKVTIEGATAEKVNEGDIYAGIKAELAFKTSLWTNGKEVTNDDDYAKELFDVDKAKVTEAYITDGNWKLSILSAAKTPTFSAGFEKKDDDTTALDAAVGKDVPGVTFEIAGWKAGLGLDATFKEGGAKNGMLTIATPSFTFDAVTVKAGAGAANKAGKFTVGGGAQAKYATDAFSATVGADLVYAKDGNKFDAAVSANVAYAPVTVDAYFATTVKQYNEYVGYTSSKNTNYLSAKVVTDLNSFDVPVTLTVVGANLINDQYLDAKAACTVSGVGLTVSGGYQVSNKTYHAGVKADYTIEKVGKVYGMFDLVGANDITKAALEAGLENTTLVSGATLKAYYKTNFAEAKKAGSVTAEAKIKF